MLTSKTGFDFFFHKNYFFIKIGFHYCFWSIAMKIWWLAEILPGQVSLSKTCYLKYLRGSAVWFWELCSYVYPPSLRTVHIMSKLVLSCTPPVSGVIVHYKNSPLHFGDWILQGVYPLFIVVSEITRVSHSCIVNC